MNLYAPIVEFLQDVPEMPFDVPDAKPRALESTHPEIAPRGLTTRPVSRFLR